MEANALLKTLLDQWNVLFRYDASVRKARSFVSLAMDARNSAAHFDRRRPSFSGVLPEPRQRAPESYSDLHVDWHNA